MKELLGSDEDDDTKQSKTEKGYVPKLIGKRGPTLKAKNSLAKCYLELLSCAFHPHRNR